MSLNTECLAFGEFVLDSNEKVLLRQGKPLPITPKIFDLLNVLVKNHGHVMDKDVLMSLVWPDSFVEESNLTFSIRQLRKLLGDDKQNPAFIETVPRRGYRFIADVTDASGRSKNSGWHTSDERSALKAVESRPSFYPALFVLLAASLLTAGYFVLDRRLNNANDQVQASPSFKTIANLSGPMTAAISPDGKYVAYTSVVNSQQSVWLRQLSSGVDSQIVPPENGMIYYCVKFSGDSEYLYVSRRQGPDKAHLDRVSILGGAVKTDILTDLDGAFSISPDNSRISFRRYSQEKRSLLTADIDGSNIRQIHETSKTFTDNVFSPDGKTIAFASGQSDTGERDFGVFLIDVNGGEVTSISDFRWYHVRGIVWLPDQSGLLVTARTTGDEPPQIWKISLTDGAVEKVTDTQNVYTSMSSTPDLGQIVVTQISRSSHLYVAPFSAPDNMQQIANASQGVNWTADNNMVFAAPSGNNHDIWSLSSDRSVQKQLTSDAASDIDPRMSPDGRYIVFVSNRAGTNNVWRIGPDGGDPVRLTSGGGEQSPVFTADSRSIIFSSIKDAGLWKVPIEGGEPVRVSDTDSYRISISRDETKFAYFSDKDGKMKIKVEVFPAGGIVNEFDLPDDHAPGRDIAWAMDDASLIYGAGNDSKIGNLWSQPITGGSPSKLTNFTSEEVFFVDLSKDGSQLAVIRGVWNHEVVLIKGLKVL